MRFGSMMVLILACACSQRPAAAAPPPRAPAAEAAPAAAPSSAGIRGRIAERIDTAQYTYLRLTTSSGEVWAAVPKTDKAVGAEVTVANVAWMENFKSNSMGRTWERIAFGTLDEGAPQSPHAHPPASAPVDVGSVKVARAAGPSGITIAGVWERKASLKGRRVSVRGKVVKATNGILGKNWLHLRDGTGQGASADLTVASTDEASVGDTVLVDGVVQLDRDLGAGYHYDVIVEDAKIAKE